MANPYMFADFRCYLDRRDLPDSWGRCDDTLYFMNECFRLYYMAWKDRADTDTLDRAAHPLYEAMDYVWTQKTVAPPLWRDESRVTFASAIFKDRASVLAPSAFVKFMRNVEATAIVIAKEAAALSQVHKKAAQLAKNERWEALGTLLDRADKSATLLEKSLWIGAATRVPSKAKKMVKNVSSFAGALDNIHQGATILADLRTGNRDKAAWGVVQLAVSCLPVMGMFYEEAIGALANMVEGYKETVAGYGRIVHSASEGNNTSQTQNR